MNKGVWILAWHGICNGEGRLTLKGGVGVCRLGAAIRERLHPTNFSICTSPQPRAYDSARLLGHVLKNKKDPIPEICKALDDSAPDVRALLDLVQKLDSRGHDAIVVTHWDILVELVKLIATYAKWPTVPDIVVIGAANAYVVDFSKREAVPLFPVVKREKFKR